MFGIGANIDQYLAVAYLLGSKTLNGVQGRSPESYSILGAVETVIEASFDQILAVVCF